ncbi:MAG: helix-turn-helix domain-containing protein [Opitutaceae bacterium]|nr:helix-turn-helix domain-containing protein [Opitutaceae bacterium]
MTPRTAACRLHELRRRLGLTQRQMARQLRVATSTVTAWEAGLYTRPLRLAYQLLELEAAPRCIKPTFKTRKEGGLWTWHVYDQRGVPQGSGFDTVRGSAERAARRFMREIRKQPLRMV